MKLTQLVFPYFYTVCSKLHKHLLHRLKNCLPCGYVTQVGAFLCGGGLSWCLCFSRSTIPERKERYLVVKCISRLQNSPCFSARVNISFSKQPYIFNIEVDEK